MIWDLFIHCSRRLFPSKFKMCCCFLFEWCCSCFLCTSTVRPSSVRTMIQRCPVFAAAYLLVPKIDFCFSFFLNGQFVDVSCYCFSVLRGRRYGTCVLLYRPAVVSTFLLVRNKIQTSLFYRKNGCLILDSFIHSLPSAAEIKSPYFFCHFIFQFTSNTISAHCHSHHKKHQKISLA